MRTGKQAEMMRKSGYVTAKEVADAVFVTLPTVHNKLKSGQYPGERFGWGWYIRIHDFIDLAEFPKDSPMMRNLEKLRDAVGARARADAGRPKPKVKKTAAAKRAHVA